MEFITSFPRIVRHHDSIGSGGHFDQRNALHSNEFYILIDDVTHIFIKVVVRLHGVLKKIMKNRNAKFTSKFWKELFAGLGTDLAFFTTYHP